MKTLYESMLDNEGTLISRGKEKYKNPFYILYQLYEQNDKDIRKADWRKIIEILKPLNLPNDVWVERESIYDLSAFHTTDPKKSFNIIKAMSGESYFRIYFKPDRTIMIVVNITKFIKTLWGSEKKLDEFLAKIIKQYKLKELSKGIYQFKL